MADELRSRLFAARAAVRQAGRGSADVPTCTRNPRFTGNPDAKAKAIYDGTYPG